MKNSKQRVKQKTKQEENNSIVLRKTVLQQLDEFLDSGTPDIASIKKEIVNLKMTEEDQIKDAFKEGVKYGNGIPQTFDYPESRYYCYTYGYSNKK